MWAWVPVPDASLPFQVPADGLRKAAARGPGVWSLATHLGDLGVTPASAWLVWPSGERADRRPTLSVSFCVSPSLSDSWKIKKPKKAYPKILTDCS